MSEEKMINDATLETIAGGTVRVVKNKSIGYATVRNEPSVKAVSLARSATAPRSTQQAEWSGRTI